jgi:acetate kinase
MSDVRDLLAMRDSDPRAADALDLFCYQAKKWVGAYAAALGGLDTIVFSGGIGEHSPEVRAAICAGLEFLGIRIEPTRNESGASIISDDDSPVTVRVIATDEESVVAEVVSEFLIRSQQ